MQQIAIILLSILSLFTLQSDQPLDHGHPYVVTGKVINVDQESPIVISVYDPITQIKTGLDTTHMSADGTYRLSFHFDHADLFRVDFPNRQYVMLAIDEGQKKIMLNVEGKKGGTVSIEGSSDSQKLLGYDIYRGDSNKRLIKPTYEAMSAAAKSGDGKQEAEAVAEYVKASREHRQELFDYTKENIGTSIALYGTILRWTEVNQFEELENLVDDFRRSHPELPMSKVMMEKMERYKKVALGAIAPDLTAKNQNESDISLHQQFGKYTLIDFWASWCGPCIRQLPDLHEAYDQFDDLGFEIVSVSVDRSLEKWQGAIEKHEMDWKHISDVKGWASPLAAEYNVTFVPFNLLVDEKGKIIAKNIHSETLQGRLTALLKS